MCFGGGGNKPISAVIESIKSPQAVGPMSDPNAGARKRVVRPGMTDIAVPKTKSQTLLGSPLVSGSGGGKTLLGR